MQTLSASQLIDVWETGERQHPLDRALTLLASACPEKTLTELAQLSIGERDALLFRLRRLMLGPDMDAYAECPACGAALEFTIDFDRLLGEHARFSRGEQSTDAEGFAIRYHLPNSYDLAECVNSGSVDENDLLKRCVFDVTRGGKTVSVGELTPAAVSALLARMSESDPLSEVKIVLDCPECRHHFSMLLDILSFFWSELSESRRQLLQQVCVLAGNFGWSEADILAMSPRRREYYMNMVV